MPEYLAPGVYLEEYDADPQPIPGVSTSIDDATAHALIERFKDLVPPDWTGFNESDPGVTLANLFAWLTENLLYRTGSAADARCEAALRTLLPLLSCNPFVRPRYFAGQILDPATLEAEQDYHRDKLRRHNLALHGFGVVSGLGVRVEAGSDGPRVVVDPGYAIDPLGDEQALPRCAALRIPVAASEAFVSLRGWERPFAPVPTLKCPEDSRIEEACVIAISRCIPATAVALAHLVGGPDGWAVDTEFVRPMASCRSAD
jgi:hypothetical protein